MPKMEGMRNPRKPVPPLPELLATLLLLNVPGYDQSYFSVGC